MGLYVIKKPIVGVVNKGNDVKELINNNNAGYVSTHGEGIEKLSDHCVKLSDDISLMKKQGLNSYSILLEFTPEKTANQILDFFF